MFGGEKLADLVARKTFGAAQVICAAGVVVYQLPSRACDDIRAGGTAEFVGKEIEGFAGAPGIFHFLIEATIAAGRMTAG